MDFKTSSMLGSLLHLYTPDKYSNCLHKISPCYLIDIIIAILNSFSVSIHMNPSTFLSIFPEKDVQNLITFHYPTILVQTNHHLSFVLVSHNWPPKLSLLHYILYFTHSCHHAIINTDQLMPLFYSKLFNLSILSSIQVLIFV